MPRDENVLHILVGMPIKNTLFSAIIRIICKVMTSMVAKSKQLFRTNSDIPIFAGHFRNCVGQIPLSHSDMPLYQTRYVPLV